MLTIDGSFRESVRSYPDHIAMRYYQDERWESISYSEMNNAVNIIAHGIADLGVNRDSKIAVMSENRPEWMVAYLAALTSGAVAVPIDAVLGEVETTHILNHSEAQTIFCSMRCYETIGRIMSDVPHLRNIVIFDRNITVRHDHHGEGKGRVLADKGKKSNGHKNFLSYDDLREHGKTLLAKGEVCFPEKTVEDLSCIIYTSGTTGMAKGVMLTHRNIMSNVDAIKRFIVVLNTDNFLLLLPLHHTFPFTICLALPLSLGGSVSFVDIMSRDRTRLIEECKPTIMVGVPLLYSKIYKGIIRQIEISKVKSALFKYGGRKIIGAGLKRKLGGKLRLMVSGAAPMDPAVIDGIVNLGIEFLEGYGLTESSPVISCNPIGKIKVGSIGIPVPGVEVKVDNPDQEGIGEILAKGPNIMQGYYRNPEASEQALRNGWLYTGDLGKIDKDGYIFITGRAKDVIVNRGGKNVYPESVEAEINKSRFIAESVVLGYQTKGMVGEDVGVLINPDYEMLIEHAKAQGIALSGEKDIAALTEEDKDELIEKFKGLLESEVRKCMEKVASYQRVTRIGIERDEFTKTSTRKIKRFLYKGRLDIVDIK
ncbi:MAG: AMP-dependent synthetase/ligase [Candidatus Latescibacterota bacterium]